MADALYIRIKRRDQTFFIHVAKSTKIYSLKSEISQALSGSSSSSSSTAATAIPENMKLYKDTSGEDSSELPDVAAIGDHDIIKDDGILYLTLKNGSQWESIDIVEMTETEPAGDGIADGDGDGD
uniref:Ubiquitin-like domain-containing protein n=1 Tax=Chaetoceros debilis TaxID=122233 RepID=A0A7S3VD19_9STRA|mmetsp:Transcript_14741/g.22022  ORF Transcript_14741/g.22022 Transcript_14741/m.22022 type:complete len:125 (-) Transcript_14741:559-933(-)|eukprot:CAMPEP_0194097892 /NCGR_PEP_ID=MMETSP0149-20130528/58096_1 /TAXON_ID=122233 /ORGANISM="Chaetoceros debilis, Strain MM31A-1" /LENGTH=124 /DNA_ID=CAMNT_0038783921 /DNA_START=69 /DNA_END=443 /DNA_ORIENTATION=+